MAQWHVCFFLDVVPTPRRVHWSFQLSSSGYVYRVKSTANQYGLFAKQCGSTIISLNAVFVLLYIILINIRTSTCRKHGTGTDTLDKASYFITKFMKDYSYFEAEWAFVATWSDYCLFSSPQSVCVSDYHLIFCDLIIGQGKGWGTCRQFLWLTSVDSYCLEASKFWLTLTDIVIFFFVHLHLELHSSLWE